MKVSQFLLATVKETPADAELISHRLMIRAGLVRKLASGLYTWLPLGWRVLQKVMSVIRKVMNETGALEIAMPHVQPAELWKKTGRWAVYGSELLKIQDRHGHDFCFAPTHEEVVVDVMQQVVHTYKALPITFYQIQTKFRDEIRPRFGVMRAREFLMKDAYSFDLTSEGLQKTYDRMRVAYQAIFTELGLEFRAVEADTGPIGGKISHEFQVLANAGEDTVVYSNGSDYAANLEKARAYSPERKIDSKAPSIEKIPTPGIRTIGQLCDLLAVPVVQTVKTLLVKGANVPLVALVLRGDHTLNFTKAGYLPEVLTPVEMADEETVRNRLGCGFGSLGPVGLSIPVVVDEAAAAISNFYCGANEEGYHFAHVVWDRDVALTQVHDIRNVVDGDRSPDGQGVLKLTQGIEVGHIFQLGEQYSQAIEAFVADASGKRVPFQMGCYGIGVSRVVAAAIEQHHDEKGIAWPQAMAPFDIALITLQWQKSSRVREAGEKIYCLLQEAGYDVLWDDRVEHPGVLFADMDLIGIPHRLVVSERTLKQGQVEYKARTTDVAHDLPVEQLLDALRVYCTPFVPQIGGG